MTPVEQIAQLSHLAVTDSQFQTQLLDPDTRGEALEAVQAGWKKYDGVPLTEKEIAGLLKIDATDMPGFALGCANYERLTGNKG